MNKLHIFVLGMILLFLLGCLANQQTGSASWDSTSPTSVSGNTGTNQTTPTLSDEIEKCGGLSSVAKVSCYTTLAVERNNPGICKMQEGSYDEDDCIIALAIKYNKPEYCVLSPNPYSCNIKFETFGASSNWGNQTTPTLSDEAEKCSKMGSSTFDSKEAKASCYTTLALEHNNPGICKMQESSSYEDECITALAVKYNKPEYCGLASYQLLCYNIFKKAG